jgi:hypothetical protein
MYGLVCVGDNLIHRSINLAYHTTRVFRMCVLIVLEDLCGEKCSPVRKVRSSRKTSFFLRDDATWRWTVKTFSFFVLPTRVPVSP